MGMIEQPPFLADCTNLPTYVTDTVVRRDIGGGTASMICCRTLSGMIVPLCEVIISPVHLLSIAQAANAFALEMHRKQMAMMVEAIGMRH